MNRSRVVGSLLFFAIFASQSAVAQERSLVDLSGTWRWLHQEDYDGGGAGDDPGEYWGLPLNDAARMRADTYNEEWLTTSPYLQCRPRPVTYQPLGLDPMQIEKVINPLNRQLLAYRVSYEKTPGARMIWLDGRSHPSQYAKHSWEGFSTGKLKGNSLEITSTHIKEGFQRRNGVPTSFHTTVVESISLDEPYMTWVLTTIDPDYLTEPLVRSVTYIRAPNLQVPAYPCQPEDTQTGSGPFRVPHFLVGQNPFLTEVASRKGAPLEAVRGGAETLYPEWRAAGLKLSPPAAESAFKPVYKDASTRVAELADAQPKRPPAYDQVEMLHVAGNVYMLAGAGGNIALSVGEDGIVMVDSGAAAATDKVLAAARQVALIPRPADRPDGASPFGDTWQATHASPEPAIRMIINTSDDPDHAGGNAKIRTSPMFQPIGVEGGAESLEIFAHENAQHRMIAQKTAADLSIPSQTYLSDKYTLHRFFNNQAVQIFHMANATSDGDSAVWFRRSDVIATGEVYNSDMYPPLDLARGGSIGGEIESLNKLVDLCVTEFMSQGGTLLVPGHGWISDAADLGLYRDMIIIIRDRIQDMIDKGMTLDQVKAAKPTMDYDPEFGRQPGVTARFVEAVYRSLKEKNTK